MKNNEIIIFFLLEKNDFKSNLLAYTYIYILFFRKSCFHIKTEVHNIYIAAKKPLNTAKLCNNIKNQDISS